MGSKAQMEGQELTRTLTSAPVAGVIQEREAESHQSPALHSHSLSFGQRAWPLFFLLPRGRESPQF